MKFSVFCFFALLAGAAALSTKATTNDRTITKVVKLLQNMLEESKKDGDKEKEVFGKFKCFCDSNEAEKNANIKEMAATISTLDNKIDELQGDNGALSSECATLKADLAENAHAQQTATSLRKKENTAFKDFMADSKEAESDMTDAIKTLAAVGADQTKSDGAADTKKFMSGFSALLQKKQARVQKALDIASNYMDVNQKKKASAFLQAPFTSSYTSQSAQIMGMLKNMRDTFIKNMADAETTEAAQFSAYNDLMDTLKDEEKTMNKEYDTKQGLLGDNDGELSDKRKQLAAATKSKANDEEFLEKLIPMCEAKTKDYEDRKMLRANEESAIAEAISILNSDDAFATFQGTDAGTTGFIQLRAVRRHMSGVKAGAKKARAVMEVLNEAASKAHSSRLLKVAAMVKADNVFAEVLAEIEKMLDLIKKEGEADKENLDWCNDERKVKDQLVSETNDEIDDLEASIDQLTNTIENERDGLKKQIADEEQALEENIKSQKDETAQRTKENLAYQADVKTLVASEELLKKALKVLSTYYDDMEKQVAAGVGGFLQTHEDPKAFAWGSYEGNSGGGNKAIGMLEFILKSTLAEEDAAHKAEDASQAEFEDSMTKAKKLQANQEGRIVSLQETLAEKEEELASEKANLKAEEKLLKETEDYLLKIRPGCDFITVHFKERESSRGIESAALKKATGLIKATPVYKSFKADERSEGFGDCQAKCEDAADEKGAECQACLAGVTIPAYCAGHKGTPGC